MTAIVVAPRWTPSESRWVRSKPPTMVCSLCAHPLELRGYFEVWPTKGSVRMLCDVCQPSFLELETG